MPNNAYQRGRRWEWAVQKLFKDQGHLAMRTAGSHGVADVIVCRTPGEGDGLAFVKPLLYDDVEGVLADWVKVHDPKKILDPYLFGFRKFLPRGGEVMIHASPVNAWYLQLKTTRGK
jgi:hypothetical protein